MPGEPPGNQDSRVQASGQFLPPWEQAGEPVDAALPAPADLPDSANRTGPMYVWNPADSVSFPAMSKDDDDLD